MEKPSLKALFAATIGTTLEFYDFALFGFLVFFFAPQFFPTENPFISTLYGYTIFSLGYFIKPLGAIFWGHLGDKYGRRKALSQTLYLMGFSTLLMGIIPSYEKIGIVAPLLLLLARILQGFSEGGELSGGLLMGLEHTPVKNKGTAGGLFNGICTSGILFGSFAGYLCSLEGAPSFAWRIPFLLGFTAVALGIYIRKDLEETPVFKSIKPNQIKKFPLISVLKKQPKAFFSTMIITGLPGVAFHINFIYLPSYLNARLSGTLALLALVVLLPFWGYLSDKVGQGFLMKIGTICIFAISLIFFSQIHTLNPDTLLAVFVLFSLSLSLFNGPWCGFVSTIFNKETRYSAIGTANTIGGALFGSTAPLIGAWLTQFPHGEKLLAGYIALWAIFGFLAILQLEKIAQVCNAKTGDLQNAHAMQFT